MSTISREGPPSGPGWLHEIKHDGFRILARKDAAFVRLITRAGNDFSSRFPFIAMAVAKLPVRSCLIDNEAIVCDENGLADFELIRGHGSKASALRSNADRKNDKEIDRAYESRRLKWFRTQKKRNRIRGAMSA